MRRGFESVSSWLLDRFVNLCAIMDSPINYIFCSLLPPEKHSNSFIKTALFLHYCQHFDLTRRKPQIIFYVKQQFIKSISSQSRNTMKHEVSPVSDLYFLPFIPFYSFNFFLYEMFIFPKSFRIISSPKNQWTMKNQKQCMKGQQVKKSISKLNSNCIHNEYRCGLRKFLDSTSKNGENFVILYLHYLFTLRIAIDSQIFKGLIWFFL